MPPRARLVRRRRPLDVVSGCDDDALRRSRVCCRPDRLHLVRQREHAGRRSIFDDVPAPRHDEHVRRVHPSTVQRRGDGVLHRRDVQRRDETIRHVRRRGDVRGGHVVEPRRDARQLHRVEMYELRRRRFERRRRGGQHDERVVQRERSTRLLFLQRRIARLETRSLRSDDGPRRDLLRRHQLPELGNVHVQLDQVRAEQRHGRLLVLDVGERRREHVHQRVRTVLRERRILHVRSRQPTRM